MSNPDEDFPKSLGSKQYTGRTEMDSLFAEFKHSLSWTRRSLRNQTMEHRRRPAEFEGSDDRRGARGRGAWRGEAEIMDLKEFLGGLREEEERERCARDEI